MSIRIIRPGMLTTVQDEGRRGFQCVGVSVAGPMDWVSHRLANLLVGNRRSAATLEVTLIGPEIRFEDESVFTVTGAEFQLVLDGLEVPTHVATRARRGATLRFGDRRRGARAYVAVAGGFDVPPVLGSRSTHLVSRVGGVGGRALVAGDRIPAGTTDRVANVAGRSRPPVVGLPGRGARLRVMLGPEDDWFSEAALATLQRARYEITPQSNRMGYRLTGPRLSHRESADMLSDGTPIGSVQVPASGEPILLMADCQTTGGYPKIATVITADIPVAGQLAPADWIEFEVCDRQAAVAAVIAQEQALSRG